MAVAIVDAEYFWDIDEGIGSNSSISVIPTNPTQIHSTIDIPNTPGMHRLCFRVKNDYDFWSMTTCQYYYINEEHMAVAIVDAEYFWDIDEGIGSNSSISVIPTNPTQIHSTIDIPVTLGMHRLCIRVKNDYDFWSMTTCQYYFINEEHIPIAIVEAEYFWDTDNGIGSGIAIDLDDEDINIQQTFNASLDTLSPNGTHELFVRVLDDEGIWSLYSHMTIYQGDSIFVDQSASGSNDGTTWAHAFIDLQDALHFATRGSIILMAEGTYKPDQSTNDRDSSFYMTENLHIVGGFPAGGGIIPNPEIYLTILSGDIGSPGDSSDNSYHVVITENVGDDLRVENLTIKGGYLNGGTTNFGGGGWYNQAATGESSPQIINCKFENNHAQYHGGGFASLAGTNGIAQPLLKNCQFINNDADDGGALSSIVSSNGVIHSTIENCVFENNVATDFGGGIFHNTNINSSHKQFNCVFFDNFGAKGGAVSHLGTPKGDYINCSFANNRASSYGGHMDVDQITDSLQIQLTNCIIGDEHPLSNGPYVTTNTDKVYLRYSVVDASLNSWLRNGGNNYFNEDPQFIDEAQGDLRISANSKAVNRGLNGVNELALDAEANPRIKHGVIDIGAYEVQADSCDGKLTLSGEVCSNPFVMGETISISYQELTGPGLFDIVYNDSLYSQINSGALLEQLVAGTDISGTPPFFYNIHLDSIYDHNGECIANHGTIDSKSIQVTDTVTATLIPGPKDHVHCAGDTIQYTINMNGGSGEYKYRFFLDSHELGVLNVDELLFVGTTTSTTAMYPYTVQNRLNMVGVEVRDNLTNCLRVLMFDTTVVDTINPVVSCQDITVTLDSLGMAFVNASEINMGSTDNCGLADISLSRDLFYCSHQGVNQIELSGTDLSGNVSVCQAEVTVLDTLSTCAIHCSPVVSTKNEFGFGSLKHSLSCVDAGDTITFSPSLYGDTLRVWEEVISIKKNVDIIEDKLNNIYVDSSPQGLLLHVNAAASATISGLHFIAPAHPPAVAINNFGLLVLRDVDIHQPAGGQLGVTINNEGSLEIIGDSNIHKP
jgi:hypothetical protein